MMQALTAIAVLMFVSAITPGPNNMIVLRRASSGGLVAAIPAMTGIVVGGVAMFALAEAGLAALVVDSPRLLTAIVLGGGLYLAYLGLVLMRSSGAPTTAAVSAGGGVLAMFAFQFANPKAWVLVMTAVGASRRAGDPQGWLDVATVPALFAVISLACLCAWALLGRLASRLTQASSARAWFDRVMGLVLIASAISLLMNE